MIDKANKVVITDYSNYEPSKSRNGGCYLFTTIFTRVSGEMWQISYGTSAEFEYCPVQGIFRQCKNCWNLVYEGEFWDSPTHCGLDYQVVSTREVLKAISEADVSEDYEVEIIY